MCALIDGYFYTTYFLLAELQSRNVDALFEQHSSRKQSTEIRPQWMTAEQYASGTLTIRELEIGGRVAGVNTDIPQAPSPKMP